MQVSRVSNKDQDKQDNNPVVLKVINHLKQFFNPKLGIISYKKKGGYNNEEHINSIVLMLCKGFKKLHKGPNISKEKYIMNIK